MGDVSRYDEREPNEDDDDDVDENQFRDQKDAILFLIRVSDSMVHITDEGPSALKTTLQCAYELLLQKIISNPKDMVGIVLYGTEKTKVTSNYPHIYTLVDLEEPGATAIKELKALLNDDEALYKLCTPSKEPASMSNVLFAANNLMTDKAARFGSKRVFLVTDDDSPPGNKDVQKAVITRARDLNDIGVRLEPFFISHADKPPFDITKFYENVIYRDDEDQDDGEYHLPVDASARFDTLLSMIKAKQTPRRSQFNIPMELGPDMQIGIKGFILYKRQEIHRSHYVYANGEKLELAIPVSVDVDPNSSQVIPKEQIQKAYKFGGDFIVFSEDEFKQIRNFGEPVLRIIGFKPAKQLRFQDNLRPSYFIYPSDATVTGSTRTFASLHKKMLKDDLMAIAWFIPRRNQAPMFTAVVPQEEEFDEKGGQLTPPGMHCIILPTIDDFRSNPFEETAKAPEPLIDEMAKIATALTLKSYRPEKYPNPALQWHYRILQASALEEDMPEQPEDKTVPKYKSIHQRTAALAYEWGTILDQVDVPQQIQPSSQKRKAVTNGKQAGESAPKKIKKETDRSEAPSKDKIESMVQQGTLMTLKLDQLKQACSDRGIPAGKTKALCVEALEDYFSRG